MRSSGSFRLCGSGNFTIVGATRKADDACSIANTTIGPTACWVAAGIVHTTLGTTCDDATVVGAWPVSLVRA